MRNIKGCELMRKLSILLLAAALLFLVACGGEFSSQYDPNDPFLNAGRLEHDVDVGYYARQGRIDTLTIKIGDTADDVKKYYNFDAELESALEELDDDELDDELHEDFGEDNFTIAEFEFDDFVELRSESVAYYYMSAGSAQRIVSIVNFGDSYGFIMHVNTIEDVREALGEAYEDRPAEESDLFFMFSPQADDHHILSYIYDNMRVKFFFNEDLLVAVSLSDIDEWSPIVN